MKAPMNTSLKLDMDEGGVAVNSTQYVNLISPLVYLKANRCDITFVVGVCVRFQSNPKRRHMEASKRILRYLKGTTNVGIWYSKDDNFELIRHSDANFRGCKINRKSTNWTCQFLGSKLVFWFSKEQTSTTTSTTNAEYVVAASCALILWMKQQLSDYNITVKDVPSYYDNNNAIAITQNPVFHSKTKHTDIRHYFIRDRVEKRDFRIEKINTKKQVADILTKALCERRILELIREHGLLDMKNKQLW